MDKKIVYSGIQPSGQLTIGNYIGALRNFMGLQDDYLCLYCIADLHAITVAQVPKDLRKNTLDLIALYLACGLDPEKSIIYIQSHVPAHTELAWVLNTMTGLGQLQRMTQFKSKSQKVKEVQAGLLNYPVLMAADILLYQTSYVPVGEDQRQHLEITRDIAQRFNHRYSETLTVPEILPAKVGGRIMSLQDPTSKMSKSDANKDGFILIIEDENQTRKKIKKAVTDSLGTFRYCDEQKGLKNLIDIYASFSNLKAEEIVEKYKDQGYGVFKDELAELVVDSLRPIRQRFQDIREDKSYLEKVYREGAEKASYLANKTLRKVYKKVGFIER